MDNLRCGIKFNIQMDSSFVQAGQFFPIQIDLKSKTLASRFVSITLKYDRKIFVFITSSLRGINYLLPLSTP